MDGWWSGWVSKWGRGGGPWGGFGEATDPTLRPRRPRNWLCGHVVVGLAAAFLQEI